MYDNLILGIHMMSIWFWPENGCDKWWPDECGRRRRWRQNVWAREKRKMLMSV
jgi:hypothetical protein